MLSVSLLLISLIVVVSNTSTHTSTDTHAQAHGPTLILGTINSFEWMETDKETRSNNYVIICFIFSIINSYWNKCIFSG